MKSNQEKPNEDFSFIRNALEIPSVTFAPVLIISFSLFLTIIFFLCHILARQHIYAQRQQAATSTLRLPMCMRCVVHSGLARSNETLFYINAERKALKSGWNSDTIIGDKPCVLSVCVLCVNAVGENETATTTAALVAASSSSSSHSTEICCYFSKSWSLSAV